MNEVNKNELYQLFNVNGKGKICWGFLTRDDLLIDYVRANRDFLSRSMRKTINLSLFCKTRRTKAFQEEIIRANRYHKWTGWKVGHLLVYCVYLFAAQYSSRSLNLLIHAQLIFPMQNSLGQSLSSISNVFVADFPTYQQCAMENFSPEAFAHLKFMENMHEFSRKMLLFCCVDLIRLKRKPSSNILRQSLSRISKTINSGKMNNRIAHSLFKRKCFISEVEGSKAQEFHERLSLPQELFRLIAMFLFLWGGTTGTTFVRNVFMCKF